ncbi:MAG: DUF1508 domain-containing protein [Clostridia bacterium]|nr:DUF1508 domain-containing protein [Clostridia bacterium]
MGEFWNKIVTFMTEEAFKISSFSVLWWYVIVAAAAVVVLLLIVTISVACSKKKKKKAKQALENADDGAEIKDKKRSKKSKDHTYKEISPDWQPVVKAGDKPVKNTASQETEEVTQEVADNVVEETPITDVVEEPEQIAEPIKKVEPEVVPAPIKEVKSEVVPAPVKEVKAESVPAPITAVKAEAVPAPVKQVKTESVPIFKKLIKKKAPVVPETVEEKVVVLEPIIIETTPEPVQEKTETPVAEKIVAPVVEEKVEEKVVEVVKEEIIEEPVVVETVEEAQQEAVATTAPRTLPKKKSKTTKKTAAEIANEIEEKTGTNPRKKVVSDKPAVVGKDKLPKKTTKAKKEEPVVESKPATKAPAKNVNDELPLITTDPNVESFGKFVIVKNDDNSTRPYHFRLLANNGQILFESESYKTKPKSNSIIAFKKVCVLSNFEIDEDKAGNFRYKLYNNAHTVIGVGESYSTKQGCENSVQSVIKFAESARYLEDQSE